MKTHHAHGHGVAPRALAICEAERAFLERLAPLVPTPRSAKRIVNVFRLIKAAVPIEDIAGFEDAQHGRHRAVLLLLAVLYGRPVLAEELFRRLYEGDWPSTRLSDGIRAFGKRDGEHENLASAAERAAWTTLADHIATIAPDLTMAVCRDEIATLARYSLVTGQAWHRWQRGPG